MARMKARSVAPVALATVVPVRDRPRFGPTMRAVLAGARLVLVADARWPLGVPMTGAVLAVAWPSFVAMARPGVLDLALGRRLVLWPSLALALALLVLFGVRAWSQTFRPVDPVLAVWRSKVSGDQDQKTPLPGSRVWGPVRRHPWGWEVDGEGFGAVQGTDVVRKAVPGIAAAYQQPAAAFEVLDRVGNGGFTLRFVDPAWTADRDRERRDRMSRTYPLGAQVLDREFGTAEVAVQVDSGRPGLWEAYTPGVGARHGVVAGDTRMGKSAALETLATVLCRSGLVVPAFVDLAGGVTFDPWRDRVRGYADTVRDAEALMEALDVEFEDRIRVIKANAAQGWHGVWRVSEGYPLLPLFVDEGPELKASKRASAKLSRAVRQWAKAGMPVIFASQSLTIESILGREAGSVAKSQLMAGNLWAFYANQGLAGLPFDTADVPQVPGVSKLYGPRHPDAPLVRGLYSPGVDQVADSLRIPDHELAAGRGRDGVPLRVVRDDLDVVDVDERGDLDGVLDEPAVPVRTIPAALSEDAVVRALEDMGGSGSSTDVVRRSGLPQATAYAAFGRLRDTGRCSSPRRGLWVLGGPEAGR